MLLLPCLQPKKKKEKKEKEKIGSTKSKFPPFYVLALATDQTKKEREKGRKGAAADPIFEVGERRDEN